MSSCASNTIHAKTQAVIFVSCQGAELLKIESLGYIGERWCSMTPLGLMDIRPGNPFYVYVANMMTKLVMLPKVITVSPTSSTPTWLMNPRNDEPFMLKRRV